MKTKYIALLALMLCVGAFLFPTTAYASQSGNPPTVTADVEGETLRIEASGGFMGVEAIFINDQRFNFRVDGVLRVDLLAFRNSDTLAIHAVDFAGNLSNVVGVVNPLYIGIQPPPQPDPPENIPVTSSNPLTPAGQASVLDNATDGDDIEFFTFTTPAGHIFFLIVDRQRESDNVYFLNAVTEQDLIALAAQDGTDLNVGSSGGGIPVATTPQTPNEPPPNNSQEESTAPPPADDSGGGNGTIIFVIVALLVAGGAGYYFKIVRPKQQGGNCDYDDEDEDEEDIGDEMEFETETETDVAEDVTDEDYYNTDEDERKAEDD
ncbi:MAG: DUF4366 domain-containing protein [Oscillospiraceae bacterium]|nr:DUF4366 domain-containing protein [Oscillospiraceae bacterium]